jgi:membrane protein implicated in regulation of membrane protease activity
MLILYWSCFIFGGIFVALSAIGGLDDLNTDAETDIDAGLNADLPIDTDVDFAEASFELEDLGELGDLQDLGELGELQAPGELEPELGDGSSELTPALAADIDPQAEFTPLPEIDNPPLLLQILQFLVDLLKSFKFWTFGLCFFGATGVALSLLDISPELIFPCAILVGLVLGTFMAGILRLLYNRSVNSLLETSELIGAIGTVELPFDASSRGRVRFNINGMLLDYTAYTDEPEGLELGQVVLAVNCDNNKLWVVATDDPSI